MKRERGSVEVAVRQHGDWIDLSDVKLAWLWRPSVPVAGDVADPFMRLYAAHETAHVIEDLWCSLRCPWVPARPEALRTANYRFAQLAAAARVGFEMPDTLVTNDPDAFFRFRQEHPGPVISKAAGPGPNRIAGREGSVGTVLVSHGDLGGASALRHAPVTFQPYVNKRSEIRVTVIGERVHAVEIDSQATYRTRVDWRNFDARHTPHRPYTLPRSVANACRSLVRELNLVYGAIDLILTPDGKHVFLEINANGQFGWLEDRTGIPMTEELVDLLVELHGQ
jgi:glutathione synthase/RimK-type ligase-like ATP-grasp enzyme